MSFLEQRLRKHPERFHDVKIIADVFIKRGHPDPKIILAAISYAYAESGLKRHCVSDHGRSKGLFQLGTEVGNPGSDPTKNTLAIFKRRRDSKISWDPYYRKGANGFETFLRWYHEHPTATVAQMAQKFGLYVNPSSETRSGSDPSYYARASNQLLKSYSLI